MKNRKPREKLGGLCARDAIFQPDKHPDWSLVVANKRLFPVAKSPPPPPPPLSLFRAFAKALQRKVGLRCKTRGKRRGREGKKRRYSNQLASDDYLSRGTARRFFMRCSVYALIQLDERKKNRANSAST